jgi:hypothetical protein
MSFYYPNTNTTIFSLVSARKRNSYRAGYQKAIISIRMPFSSQIKNQVKDLFKNQ